MASRVGSRATKCIGNVINAHINMLAQNNGRQVGRIVRVVSKMLIEDTDKWWVEEITCKRQKWQQVALLELAICPLHLFFFSEGTDNVETSFDIERASLPFPLYELIGMTGTVGRGRRDRFHKKCSLRTFVEQLVCQIKFAKEGKFLKSQSVGNVRKEQGKSFDEKEMKKNNQKLRNWGSWEERTESMRKGALWRFEKERKKLGNEGGTGVLKPYHVAAGRCRSID